MRLPWWVQNFPPKLEVGEGAGQLRLPSRSCCRHPQGAVAGAVVAGSWTRAAALADAEQLTAAAQAGADGSPGQR